MLKLSADDVRAVAVVKAIQEGDVEALQQMLEDDPELAEASITDRHGVSRTLLHVAADWPGHFPNGPQTVRTLVAAGANVDAVLLQSNAGGAAETPLHWAASSDDVGVIDSLLDSGANIEAPGAVFTGGSPMSDAVVFAQWRAARRLLERGALTTVWQAAALGLLDAVIDQVTTQQPLPMEQITNSFWHACRGGQLAVAEYLAEQGANLNWSGYDKKMPLDVARESGVPELVQWLESRGARSAGSGS
jgi:ankyrin repeat protein